MHLESAVAQEAPQVLHHGRTTSEADHRDPDGQADDRGLPPAFPYLFSEKEANRICYFVESFPCGQAPNGGADPIGVLQVAGESETLTSIMVLSGFCSAASVENFT